MPLSPADAAERVACSGEGERLMVVTDELLSDVSAAGQTAAEPLADRRGDRTRSMSRSWKGSPRHRHDADRVGRRYGDRRQGSICAPH